ncbi:MAG: gliding motility lipoprotein GldH [Prevotellaceae bacterium]|jgi:gliding motility-associated lipoprotein GldH|nr:gliding motility lipoprotein GldH [Prevotellaceae bacterium]
MNKTKRFAFYAASLAVLFTACDRSVIYNAYKPIPFTGWNKDSAAVFSVSITDSVSTHNVYINLRNNSSYPYCNIYLFVKAISPAGDVAGDTVEYMLTDAYGRWYGKGFSKVIDNRLAFRKFVRFPSKGMYRFEIKQGMRNDILPEISDVGLRIERVDGQ